jgi:uncharacterized protein YgiM (DUF1202 family)
MKKTRLLAFFVINAVQMIAQNESLAPKNAQLYVIAASGLRLREKADAKSSVLATIPFGDSLKTDKVASLSELEKSKSPRIITIENIKGFWQKVTYKGKKGYVFSGFVSERFKPQIEKSDYLFLEEGGNCTNNVIANTSDYNWFAMVKVGEKTELKAIQKITYAAEEEYLFTFSDYKGKAEYLIGIRKTEKMRFKTSAFESVWADEKPENEDSDFVLNKKKPIFEFKNSDFMLKFRTLPREVDANIILDFCIKNNAKTQTLCENAASKNDADIPNLFLFDTKVLWYGDIDNDGKLDMILLLNGEEYKKIGFYLSSKAEKGQFLKSVAAIFYACC